MAIDTSDLAQKADRFRALHHEGRILVLPNTWDPGGARMMEWLGYPAVATASASVAYALGYDDGQQITLDAMLDVVGRVASSVKVPVTADMEWGYAEQPKDVAENMRRVLRAGAAGINLEDSIREGESMFETELQCARIRAVREMSRREGVPLFINARTDVFWPRVQGTGSTPPRFHLTRPSTPRCRILTRRGQPADLHPSPRRSACGISRPRCSRIVAGVRLLAAGRFGYFPAC